MFPLLAAKIDLSQIIGTCVLVISVLGWFVNVIQSNSANAAARPKNQSPKPQTGRSEIESLLKELSGEKQKPKLEARRESPPQPPRPQKQQLQKQQNERRAKPAASRGGQKPPAAVRTLQRQPENALPSANLGDGLRSHHLGHRVDEAVQKEISMAVQRDLGIQPATLTPAEKPVHSLVSMLRDPKGARQAFLLNEILQRPRGLRQQ